MAILAIVALLAFALGRWTTLGKARTRNDAEQWVVISEADEKEPNEDKCAGICAIALATREVASQAPCTYTVVRGHLRGRFLPLPDNAHG